AAFLVGQLLVRIELRDGEIVSEQHVGKIEAIFDQPPLIDTTKSLHDETDRLQPQAGASPKLLLFPLDESKATSAPTHHLVEELGGLPAQSQRERPLADHAELH